MPDYVGHYRSDMASPATNAFAVTPNDSADLPSDTRALYVSGSGNLRVLMVGGTTVTFTSVPAGTVLPIRVRRVLATSTTATGIVGLY